MNIRIRQFRLFFLAALVSPNACHPKPQEGDSQVLESINVANNLASGIKLTYDSIKGEKSYQTEDFPWTDTYWPLFEKSLARRWGELASGTPASGGLLGVADLIQGGSEAAAKDTLTLDLSPAEKYDILYRYRYGVNLDAPGIQPTLAKVATLEKEIDTTENDSDKRAKTSSVYSELYQSENSSKISSQFPMTTASLSDYLRYNSDNSFKFLNQTGEGSDWSWMGLCHGWAPAAIMEKTPKNHVVVNLDNKKLVLTQGDLRGLLTYSWASHGPRSEFVGTRCNLDVEDPNSTGPVDAQGRGFSGKVTLKDGQVKNFYQVRETVGLYDKRFPQARYTQAMLVQFADDEETLGVLYQVQVQGPQRTFQKKWELYPSMNALLETQLHGGSDGENVSVEIFGCWDTNPATFHAALVEKIGVEKIGFVMDRTQAGQVWNQPVHRAKSLVGEQIPVEKLPPQRLRHLTPGTFFVAEVISTVEWLGEPSKPEMTYTLRFDQNHNFTSQFQYILEFDRRGKVIGGEWGNLDSLRPMTRRGAQQIPDFLFSYQKGAKPLDDLANGFDYSEIIQRVHECSLKDPTTTVDIKGSQEPAVDCSLTKAVANP